jgi:tetratricopeptide (TPR) repeat protein
LSLFFCLSAALEAEAQESVDVAALNDQAIALSKEGKLEEAIPLWFRLLDETSAEYAFRWVFHKNIGRNFQKLGLLPQAQYHLRQAKAAAPQPDALAESWLVEAEAALRQQGFRAVTLSAGTVVAELRPSAGALARFYPVPLVWWLKEGEVEVWLRTPGSPGAAVKLAILPATETVKLELPMGPKNGQGSNPPGLSHGEKPGPRAAVAEAQRRRRGLKAAKWALLATGIVAAGTGGLTW